MATQHNFRIKNGLEVGGVLIVNSSGQLQATTISCAISATSIGVTNIVTNKVVKFNGSILDDSNITDTGSLITLGSNTTVSGTISSGAITSSGNLHAGDGTNISMDASANGQLEVDGNSYQGAIALDANAMHLYHNSSSRSLVLGTNETARLSISGTGTFTFHSNNLQSIGTISSGAITSTGNSEFDGEVQIGDTVSQNAYGLLQVNQEANNDESGIGILSSSAGRSMRLWVDETSSYINSGNGGSGQLILNQAITVSSGGNLTGVGTIRTTDGTNTSVSYGFTGDTNTGMYSPANHELGFTTNGGQRLKLNSTGADITGTLLTNNSVKVTGTALTNSTPATDEVELSGYGMIGNRGNLYITNSNASGLVQIGIGGSHNANPKLTINTSGITVAGAITATTVNTGHGANELYAMNQAVRTSDSPTFDELTVTDFVKATGNNLKFSAGGTHVLNIDVNGKIYPNTHNAYDIGFNSSTSFRHAYFAGTGNFGNINTGQGATEVHLMNQNVRTTDSPTFGGLTTTGKLTLPDAGITIADSYHSWKRNYSVTSTSPQEILYHDGTSLDTGGVYRFTAHIAGTGTDQSATAVFWNQNGTWRVNVTGQSGTSSNHPEFIISSSTNKPTIHIDHTSTYTIHIYHEWMQLSEQLAGTDNAGYTFGTDAFLGSIGDKLYFTPNGTSATGSNPYDDGDEVYHEGHKPTYSELGTMAYSNLTGTPTFATESYVGTQITNLVDSSPAALNTLNELAAALGDDANFSTTVNTNIAAKLPLAGGTMTGQLTISGDSPQMKFNDTNGDDFWLHVNSNRFYILPDRDDSGGWETPYALELDSSTNIGYIFAQRAFTEAYHPNADTWTTARTITLGGDLTGNVSINGSGNVTLTAAVVNDSHTHDGRYYTETETNNLLAGRTSLDDIRSLGTRAFTGTATTAGYISEMESDGAFDSYSSVFKTSWSYAGNFNISDGGTFGPTETAGMSHLTWTDNSSDTARGNITVLAIAPNTGGSAGRTFIYNDQGSSYSPGWREIWTSSRMGPGSGLDADSVDGINGASIARVDAGNTYSTYSNINRFYSNTNMATSTGSQSSLECFSNGVGNDAFMTFHVGSDYAIYLGLDGGTNKLSTGGWSAGAASYEIYHAGNKPSLATLGYTGATNANYITNNNQLTNGASYITSSHTGFDSRYITKCGSWNASNMPGSRHAGISVNGGEVVFQRDNPNNGQMSVLVDGAFYAGENNGFYSLYSGNSYNSKSGFNADTSGHLQFSAQTYAQFNTQHGNIQLGPMNGSYAHIYTNLGGGFYFNRTLLYANGNTMWHAGNDGSGSGLDADTLDGTQLSAIYSNSAVANTSVNKVYENSAITFGASYLQWMDNSGTGGTGLNGAQPGNPFSDWHHHLVQNHGNSGGYYVDIASSFHSDRVHFRRLQNGTFGSWREFWHNGNDGSGSGLDADLLDGYNAEEGAVNNSIVKRDGTASIKAHGLSLMRQSTPTTVISWYNEAYYNWQDYMASAGVTSCGPNGNLTAPTGLAGVTSWALRSRMEGVSTYGWNWETGGGGGGGATATSKMSLNATTGNLQITGSFTAGGDVTAYSDKKLKDDVKVIENAVEKIKQVRGITFIRNDIEDSKRQAGVIAQEVEKVLPEVVGYDKDRDTKTVAYGNMVSLLIEAIKEQQETIDKLTSRIDDIEKGE